MGEVERDRQNKTGRPEQAEQDRTGKAGEAERDKQNSTLETRIVNFLQQISLLVVCKTRS
jgi:hypothetical protein